MPATLNPPYASLVTIRTSIQNALKTDLPPDMLANAIMPLLTTVNQWSSQISIMLQDSGSVISINLIVSIRKDLFVAPTFSQTVLGPSVAELPPPFQEFQNFIHKLIDAQKADRPAHKVR